MISALDRRGWVLANTEWFMGEVIFHRENQKYMNPGIKIIVWHLDEEKGIAIIR